jgi:DNA polymerase-3 subunit delta'
MSEAGGTMTVTATSDANALGGELPAGVWSDLVGQEAVVHDLRRAAVAAAALVAAGRGAPAGRPDDAPADQPSAIGMTHAWLLIGPPGSGRSTAARAFAAALQCTTPGEPGCGHCDGCHTVLAGTHPDVELITTELLSIGVKETRALVRRAALSPVSRRWQVIVLEDSDRLTEGAGNVLLKAVEEPAPRTVWVLCAPSLDDVLPTIRSRCRPLALRTPPADAVASVLVRRDGVDPVRARSAARAAQGHIGRAKRLATDEHARSTRADVLKLPTMVTDVGGCMRAAQQLVDAAAAEAKQTSELLDAHEVEDLHTALGATTGAGRKPPGFATALKELETRQKKRATRVQRDALDLALVDLAAFYRDVLATQLGAFPDDAGAGATAGRGGTVEPVHDDQYVAVRKIAAASTPETTLRRIEAVLACREAIAAAVAPLLAVEAMALALRAG